jgi:DNA-binding transcriptional ArsR family regulator
VSPRQPAPSTSPPPGSAAGSGEQLDALFGALADSTRRHVIERIVESGPATATDLARELPISRQAVVKHLQALDAAGLVDAERIGREVRFTARADSLDAAVGWMSAVGARWDRRLDRLQRRARA